MKAVYISWMCTAPQNNKIISENVRYLGVGGHLFAIAAKKSLEYGYDGYMYGFAANEKLLKHYVDKLNAEEIGILHPYIDICISAQDERARTMNMALSNGFRTLNDLGIIELKYENTVFSLILLTLIRDII